MKCGKVRESSVPGNTQIQADKADLRRCFGLDHISMAKIRGISAFKTIWITQIDVDFVFI